MLKTCLAAGATSILFAGVGGPLAAEAQPAEQAALPHRALLDRYCVGCHNERLQTADLMLDQADVSDVSVDAELWEKVVRKLRAGMMPPVGRPRPDTAMHDGLVSWLETELDQAAALHPNPGRVDGLRRLGRAEYRNAIRDLLALEVDVADLLPPDDSSGGFDNASLGGLDPGRLEAYLLAARKVSRVAVGAAVRPTSNTVVVPSDLAQDQHIAGLPFGTRGGALVPYVFPLDAEYDIAITFGRDFLQLGLTGPAGLTEPHDVVVTLDGELVHKVSLEPLQMPSRPDATALGGQDPAALREALYAATKNEKKGTGPDASVRLPVQAGQRLLGVSFVSKGSRLAEQHQEPFSRPHVAQSEDQRTQPVVQAVEVTGPFEASGTRPADTPSRRRIFVCRPADPADETDCAKTILKQLARSAYRRPVTETDLEELLAFYHEGYAEGQPSAEGGFEAGIHKALRRLLAHPAFLFRIERDPAGGAVNSVYPISDLELASRLSFFLWSSIPDDELLDLASRGELRNPEVLEQQVRRLLADGRSTALVDNFAAQWLYLRNLPEVVPDAWLFPDFDDNLRRSMRRETELFFESILREDRSVLDLLEADYTFVDERLAKHYDIPNVYGSRFRRIEFGPDSGRGGLLGQGSILTVTAYATRTSPVLRGKWVLENILGAPPPPPPPNVPPLEDTKTEQAISMRERMVHHRANPVCASCHAMMDPIGLSLENFDAIGRWRTRTDGFAPLDVSGSLPGGITFEGVGGLKEALSSRPELFVTTLTEKLLAYALGRAVEHYDAPAVRRIMRKAEQHDYRFSSLILGIVRSTPFQMRSSQS